MSYRIPRLSLETLISLGLFAVLIAAVLALGSTNEQEIPYDLDSSGPQGLLALRLWLQEMGYQVETTDGAHFRFPHTADLLFVYPNRETYTREEAEELVRWVERGHTLVLIGPRPADVTLVEAFGVRSRPGPGLDPNLRSHQQQPLLPEAPASLDHLSFEPPLELEAAAYPVPVLATDAGQPTMIVQRVGRGIVWHLSTHHHLVNADLKDSQAGVIVPALLRTVPAGGRIVFDTYHLFGPDIASATGQIHSLKDWLYRTPAGWATVFSALVLFAYLVLQGIRLGPPLPARGESRRREAAEYVEAMAALQRRARQSPSVARHHKHRLKIGLGRPLHISPDLDDAEFLYRLREADSHLDADKLETIRRLLAGLSNSPDEDRLVQLVAEVDEVLGD